MRHHAPTGFDLLDTWRQARAEGWAVAEGSIADVEAEAEQRGWTAVPMRKGEPARVVLRPTRASEARRPSLSSQHGYGCFPLHTDGAHLADPPDLVVLGVDQPTTTATLLLRLRDVPGIDVLRSELENGIFLLRSGRAARLMTAGSPLDGSITFDPGCMTPQDLRAASVVSKIVAASDLVHRHMWLRAPQTLFIDNRHVLHGRESIRHGDGARRVDRVAYRVEALA